MIALDTNILARYYVLDAADAESPKQHARVVKLLSGAGKFFVAKTVLLEFEWVLRGFYNRDRKEILAVLDHLRGLPMLRLEDAEAVGDAIESYRGGLDFADALHLASSGQCEKFVTFDDRGFARPATRMKRKPPVTLP